MCIRLSQKWFYLCFYGICWFWTFWIVKIKCFEWTVLHYRYCLINFKCLMISSCHGRYPVRACFGIMCSHIRASDGTFNKLCLDANNTVGVFLCFGSPTALLAFQHNLLCAKWLDRAKGLFAWCLLLIRLCIHLFSYRYCFEPHLSNTRHSSQS